MDKTIQLILAFTFALLLQSFVFYMAWASFVVPVFHLPEVNYGQSLWAIVLLGVIFRGGVEKPE